MDETGNGYRVLVIEDNPAIRRNLQDILASAGYSSLPVGTGADGLACAGTEALDLVLLDLGLPDMTGLEVLAALKRQGKHQPVIVISSVMDMEERLACFRAGVDDFISKPFHPAETLARIERTIRLHYSRPDPSAGPEASGLEPLHCGPVTIDRQACCVLKHGKKLHVRRKVYDLLCLFLEHPGTVFNRDDICRLVWNGEFVSENSIWVHMNQVRKIIEEDPRQPRLLSTIQGFGYRYLPAGAPGPEPLPGCPD